MPRGVYPRGPGKRSGAQNAGNFPPRTPRRKFAKGNSGGRNQNANFEQRQPRNERSEQIQKKNVWMKNLVDLGYAEVGDPPNNAVQAILSMIPGNIHEIILSRNRMLTAGQYSPILHLGFSAWFERFIDFDKKKMNPKECKGLIDITYSEMQEVLADRTDMDDLLAVECKAVITFLEDLHKMTDPTFVTAETEKQGEGEEENEVPCFGKFIPPEDRDGTVVERTVVVRKADSDGSQMETIVRLTLSNCLRFPIISEMAIEWLGQEFQQGLWRSMNYSTLAPISARAWRDMAGIKDEELANAIAATNNLEKIIDKVEVDFPFSTELFDKRCRKYNGTSFFVKTHMAFLNTERGYSYLHRIWRSWSPYIKCNCQEKTCKDTITWFDQAIWYVFNHLDKVYPDCSTNAGRMGYFLMFIQKNLKQQILAQLAYLHVRDTMIKMANKLTVNPTCDVKAFFGNTRLVDVCELMLKDLDFLKKKLGKNKDDGDASVQSQGTKISSENYLPPRVSRSCNDSNGNTSNDMASNATISNGKVIDITDTSDTIVTCTPGEASVSKARPEPFQKNYDGVQAKLSFEKTKGGAKSNMG